MTPFITSILFVYVVVYTVDVVVALLQPAPSPKPPIVLWEVTEAVRKETSLAYARGVEDARRCFYYDGAGLHDAMDQTGHMAATARASAGGDARLVEWVGFPDDEATQEPSGPRLVHPADEDT